MDDRRTKAVYAATKQMCDELGVKYAAFDDEYRMEFTSVGEDLHIPVSIRLSPENRVLVMLCECPFSVPERGRDDVALAASMVNFSLADGSFDFDRLRGRLRFSVTSGYYDSLLGKEALYRMLAYALVITDEYNDKLFDVALGRLTVARFAELFDNGRR